MPDEKKEWSFRLITYNSDEGYVIPKIEDREGFEKTVRTILMPMEIVNFINTYNSIKINPEDFTPTIESSTEKTICTPELLEDIKSFHLDPMLDFVNNVLSFMRDYSTRIENTPERRIQRSREEREIDDDFQNDFQNPPIIITSKT